MKNEILLVHENLVGDLSKMAFTSDNKLASSTEQLFSIKFYSLLPLSFTEKINIL